MILRTFKLIFVLCLQNEKCAKLLNQLYLTILHFMNLNPDELLY